MKPLSIRGRAVGVSAKNISSSRVILQKQLIALAQGRSLDLGSDAFVSEYVHLLQTLDFKDDRTKSSFLQELSIMVMDENIPLLCRRDWFENLLEAHLTIIHTQETKLFWVMDSSIFYEFYSLHKFVSNKLSYVKRTFRHVVIKEDGWVYLTTNLFYFRESIPEKIRFYYYYDAYLNVALARIIQRFSKVKFLFFQKVIVSFSMEEMTSSLFETVLHTVFKIKKKECIRENYTSIIPFFTQVLPILVDKIDGYNYRKDLLKCWFEYWKSSALDRNIFIQKLTFFPTYYTVHAGSYGIGGCKGSSDIEVLNHIFMGKNVRIYQPETIFFSRKMAHYFHNFSHHDFLNLSKIYEISMHQALFQHIKLLDLFDAIDFYNRFRVFGLHTSENKYIEYKNFLLKLDSWGISDWDIAEQREVLGFINYGFRYIAYFTLKGVTATSIRRRSREYYEIQARKKYGIFRKWIGARYKEMSFELNNQQYEIVQLTDSQELTLEGNRMHHCVGSYSSSCSAGYNSIWSLRILRRGSWQPLVTIEVDENQTIVQANAKYNKQPKDMYLNMIRQWAKRENLIFDRW